MAQGGMSLQQQFVNFSKFGETKTDGKTITLRQLDKWFKQAQILDGKNITNTDTGVCFSKFKNSCITIPDFMKFLEDFSVHKQIPVEELKLKLTTCGLPGTSKNMQEKKIVAEES